MGCKHAPKYKNTEWCPDCNRPPAQVEVAIAYLDKILELYPAHNCQLMQAYARKAKAALQSTIE